MSSPIEDRYKKAEKDEKASRQAHRMSGVGFEFIAAVLLFGAIGWWVDWQFGFSPWGIVVGVALGFVVGLWLLIRVGMRSFKD